jgi:hypothetical protein
MGMVTLTYKEIKAGIQDQPLQTQKLWWSG